MWSGENSPPVRAELAFSCIPLLDSRKWKGSGLIGKHCDLCDLGSTWGAGGWEVEEGCLRATESRSLQFAQTAWQALLNKLMQLCSALAPALLLLLLFSCSPSPGAFQRGGEHLHPTARRGDKGPDIHP